MHNKRTFSAFPPCLYIRSRLIILQILFSSEHLFLLLRPRIWSQFSLVVPSAKKNEDMIPDVPSSMKFLMLHENNKIVGTPFLWWIKYTRFSHYNCAMPFSPMYVEGEKDDIVRYFPCLSPPPLLLSLLHLLQGDTGKNWEIVLLYPSRQDVLIFAMCEPLFELLTTVNKLCISSVSWKRMRVGLS